MKTSFRTRRKQQLQAPKTYKVITFQLQQMWFAWPLQETIKIIITDNQQHIIEPTQPQLITTKYKEKTIVVVDIDRSIYNQSKPNLSEINFNKYITDNSNSEINTDLTAQHLLLFTNETQPDILGLPLDSPPKILKATKSEFKKLPTQLAKIGNISLISNKVIQIQNHPVYIVISPQKITIDR